MKESNITNGDQVESYYIQQLLILLQHARSNTDVICWQEVFDNKDKIDASTVVNVWKDGYYNELAAVTAAGHKAILSACWYLNYVHYGPDWTPFYACEPNNFTGSAQQKKLVLGGSTTMWGEFIDATNVIPTFWPRASVVAERLWSAQSVNNAQAFLPRYESQRCRMLKRGYAVAPPNGPGFCPHEWGMN